MANLEKFEFAFQKKINQFVFLGRVRSYYYLFLGFYRYDQSKK